LYVETGVFDRKELVVKVNEIPVGCRGFPGPRIGTWGTQAFL
jgi:hypothetical protein